ncbi:MAG: PqqD family peptide modification chaperone [Petrotogales bacterium]
MKTPNLSVDEFLQFRPKRQDFEWFTNKEGLIRIKVPKFQSHLGKSFCKFIGKENTFVTNLDKLGTIVWKNCDGKNTVKQILEIIKKELPKEKDIDQRLFLFLRQMKNLRYIDF